MRVRRTLPLARSRALPLCLEALEDRWLPSVVGTPSVELHPQPTAIVANRELSAPAFTVLPAAARTRDFDGTPAEGRSHESPGVFGPTGSPRDVSSFGPWATRDSDDRDSPLPQPSRLEPAAPDRGPTTDTSPTALSRPGDYKVYVTLGQGQIRVTVLLPVNPGSLPATAGQLPPPARFYGKEETGLPPSRAAEAAAAGRELVRVVLPTPGQLTVEGVANGDWFRTLFTPAVTAVDHAMHTDVFDIGREDLTEVAPRFAAAHEITGTTAATVLQSTVLVDAAFSRGEAVPERGEGGRRAAAPNEAAWGVLPAGFRSDSLRDAPNRPIAFSRAGGKDLPGDEERAPAKDLVTAVLGDHVTLTRPRLALPGGPDELNAASAGYTPLAAGLLGDIFPVDAAAVERGLQRFLDDFTAWAAGSDADRDRPRPVGWFLTGLVASAVAVEMLRRHRRAATQDGTAAADAAWLWPSGLTDLTLGHRPS